MNKTISKLYVFVLLLFALLVVWTSRWTVFSATKLDNNPLNQLTYFATLKVKRGRILASDGSTVLAKSVSQSGGTYSRTYPYGSLFAQTVGYDNLQLQSSTGLEQEYATQLENRQQTTLSAVFGPLSTSNVGNDVYTTLNPRAQELARTQLAGQVGSVIAIQPQTGDVLAMYSNPSYNDNNPNGKCAADDITATSAELNPGEQDSCYSDLATQSELAPGSTFKLVTTAAALNTGKYTPNTLINGPASLMDSGRLLHNDTPVPYGEISLTDALTYSVNTVFAQVGEALGAPTMQDYMERFGFYKTPPIDLPSGNLLVSGERIDGNLVPVTNSHIDLGRTAIGQANLAVTPLQMADVVSTIADDGRFMAPRLVTKIVNPDGQTVQTIAPREVDQAMSAKSASEEREMMTHVVEEGTGQSADLPGLQGEVAGKTGTATVVEDFDGEPLDDAWFVGLAPVSNPKVAVAVVLRNIPNGYGGQYAAPIAAQMIKTLLAEGL